MSGKLCLGLGLMCLTGWSCAQELMQGHVFTPEKGKADLALRAEEYVDRKSWEERVRAEPDARLARFRREMKL